MDKPLDETVASNLKLDAFLVAKAPIMEQMSTMVLDALRAHRMVFILGSGPTSSLAQHVAHEFTAKFGRQSKRLPVLALTAGRTLLGVVGSDYGEEDVLVREVSTFVNGQDVAIGLAHSSRESDMAQAMAAAVERGAHSILVIGKDSGDLAKLVDLCVSIPTADAPRIDECLLAIGHALYQVIDAALSSPAKISASESLTKFACRNCGGSIVVSTRFAGRKGSCPHCGHINVVPKDPSASQGQESTIEKRRHLRFAVRQATVEVFPVTGDMSKEFSVESVRLVNLSLQGCLVETRGQSALDLHDRVLVKIHVPAFPTPISVTGEVARQRRLPGKKSQSVGIKFIFFEEDSAEKLQQLESNRVLRNLKAAE